MTYATSGHSQQNFVAVKNGRAETEYYGSDGTDEPSAPYIYGACAGAVVEQSTAKCGTFTGSCGPSGLNVLNSWSGGYDVAQTGTTCSCAYDPRHALSLQANSGGYVYANGGGGASMYTDAAGGWGAWQALYANQYSGSDGWRSGLPLAVSTFDGHFVSSTFSATGTTPTPLYFFSSTGASTIRPGDRVRIAASTSSGLRYAYESGSNLSYGSSPGTNPAYTFKVVEPVRHLVYLKTYHGKFVDIEADGYFYNRRTQAELEYGTSRAPVTGALDPAQVATQAQAALWLIDWNGGALVDGDAVSFQVYQNDAWTILATGASTGQVFQYNSAGPNETFVLHKLGGSSGTSIAHGDTVTFKSSIGTWLTAMPPDYYSSQIRNYGTYEGAWQQMTLDFVHSFDMDRTRYWK
jgi:hypothetical protein